MTKDNAGIEKYIQWYSITIILTTIVTNQPNKEAEKLNQEVLFE